MPLIKQNNVFKITINEKEYVVKYFDNSVNKDNMEIYIDNRDMSFKGLKEFFVYVNFLTDICENIKEEMEEKL